MMAMTIEALNAARAMEIEKWGQRGWRRKSRRKRGVCGRGKKKIERKKARKQIRKEMRMRRRGWRARKRRI